MSIIVPYRPNQCRNNYGTIIDTTVRNRCLVGHTFASVKRYVDSYMYGLRTVGHGTIDHMTTDHRTIDHMDA